MAVALSPMHVGNQKENRPEFGSRSPSFSSVVASCKRLVSQSVSKHARRMPIQVRVDLEQEALLALWRASKAFDPGRGVPFENYAARAIARAVGGAAQSEYHPEETAYEDLFCGPFDRGDEFGLDEMIDFVRLPLHCATQLVDEPFDRCLCNQIGLFVAELKPSLRQIYHAHFCEGRSQPEVAALLGVSQQRVSKLTKELLAEIQRYVGEAH